MAERMVFDDLRKSMGKSLIWAHEPKSQGRQTAPLPFPVNFGEDPPQKKLQRRRKTPKNAQTLGCERRRTRIKEFRWPDK